LKGILLFLAHSFAFDITATLLAGNPLFCRSLKTSKTEISISGFIPYLGPEKDLLFVRHKNSFVFILRQQRTHASPYTFYQLHDYLSFKRTE
jgi:hypothetical protein